MKKYFWLVLAFVALMVSCIAFGQVAVDPTVPLPTDDFFKLALATIASFKGASVLVIVSLVTQLILAFFRTSLANFAGKYKLIIVLALSLVAGVVSAFASGSDWVTALLSGTTMAALQVLIHQIYIQFVKKADETPAVTK